MCWERERSSGDRAASDDAGQVSRTILEAQAIHFATHLVEAVGAQLEFLTESAEDRGFLLVGIVGERAGDVVGAFPLFAVVDEGVTAERGTQPLQRLGV